MKTKSGFAKIIFFSLLLSFACGDKNQVTPPPVNTGTGAFYFGADLSFTNQILDHNGVFKDNGVLTSPYKIFKDHGANLVRLRLWNNPTWTKEVYGTDSTQLYNDILDAEKTIQQAKDQGMSVLLDLHYSDTWADPSHQEIPNAWMNIKELNVLKDSVYDFTLKTLTHLNNKNLMPEFVQIGNETNCGMFYSNAVSGFPTCNACNNQWQSLGAVINQAISAVRTVALSSSIKTKIILHVADPKNVEWWFDNIKSQGSVTDFDIVGFSYYPLWHTTVTLDALSDNITTFKGKYNKEVMILETAYPWTSAYNDSYNNQFGSETPVAGYPYTQQGQFDILKKMTQEVKDGGGYGIIYWAPDWITSNMKDQYGTGSSWENAAFFDFSGNPVSGIDYMKFTYTK